jgi:Flp pilus assembly protein TadD
MLASSDDLRVPLTKRTITTPVQNLNREGVRQLKKGNEKKAKQYFYKAYLLDPNDPFTLNNLGYVSELDGEVNRALRFYALAAKSETEAVIDEASRPGLKGQPITEAYNLVHDSDLEANKVNEQAIAALEKGRMFEARALLKSALPQHRNDPFVLNNLGFVAESEGDLESALRYYSAAASLHSDRIVVVTPRDKWRGKPISQVAAENAQDVSELIAKGEDREAAVARLNLRGVVALNDNHPDNARGFFLQAYKLDPQNAFTLNNVGYISEISGDRESAEMYYEAARSGLDSKDRVTYSTRIDVEGRKLDALAQDNQQDVTSVLRGMQQAKRRAQKPIGLKTRGPSESEPSMPTPPLGVKNPPLPPLQLPNPAPENKSPDEKQPAPPQPDGEANHSPQHE